MIEEIQGMVSESGGGDGHRDRHLQHTDVGKTPRSPPELSTSATGAARPPENDGGGVAA